MPTDALLVGSAWSRGRGRAFRSFGGRTRLQAAAASVSMKPHRGRDATADQAWQLGDGAKVFPVAITPQCGNGEDGRARRLRSCIGDCWRTLVRGLVLPAENADGLQQAKGVKPMALAVYSRVHPEQGGGAKGYEIQR
jgi:hypothetical protein